MQEDQDFVIDYETPVPPKRHPLKGVRNEDRRKYPWPKMDRAPSNFLLGNVGIKKAYNVAQLGRRWWRRNYGIEAKFEVRKAGAFGYRIFRTK